MIARILKNCYFDLTNQNLLHSYTTFTFSLLHSFLIQNLFPIFALEKPLNHGQTKVQTYSS